MSITQKVAIAVGFTASLVTILLWLALQFLMAPRFEQLEIEKATENFERAQNAIVRELLQLSAYRRDYGVWNDAYEYMTGEYPEFLEEQVPLSLLPELNVNLFVYLDAAGKIADGVAVARESEAAADINEYLPLGYASWRAFQAVMTATEETEVIIATSAGYILAAYAPVTRTDGSGDFAGHLLVGRLIDDTFLKTLRAQTRVEISVSPIWAHEDRPLDAAPAIARTGSEVTVSSPLFGYDNRPILQLSAVTPAKITAIGRDALNSIFMAVLATVAIGIIVISAMIQGYVVGPIRKLTKIILVADKAPIDRSNTLDKLNDEIGILYKTYKDMFSRIEERSAELSAALAAAESAERVKAQFLANMSHEIRTPMNGVLGVAELLATTDLDEKQRDLVSVILRSGDALLTIINDILDFSKLDAGKTALSPAPFNLRDAIDDIAVLFSARATAKEVEFIVDIDPDLPVELVGDAGRIRQILVNLIGNAVKFTREGFIRLRVTRADDGDEDCVLFTLTDTGCGIEKDKLDLIFEKFSQADISSTRAHEGSGLGLAIARSLVELMGGKISVTSETGRGSTFSFFVKLAPPTQSTLQNDPQSPALIAKSEAQANGVASHEGGIDVLVAEDNEVNRMVVEFILKGAGYSYAMAVNGRDAVEQFKAHRPRLILMDISMPELNGLEATAEIRRIEADEGRAATPIIGVSAHAMEGDKQYCLASGMDAFVSKPVSPNLLTEEIARFYASAATDAA